jgi:hypothetical protein
MELVLLLAHAGHGHGVDGGAVALGAIAIAAMVVPFLILGGIGRVFWRAWKRDEAERRQ